LPLLKFQPSYIPQSCNILPCQSIAHQESNGGRVISGGKQNALGLLAPVPLREPEMNPIPCDEQTQSNRLRYGTELWPFTVSYETLHNSHKES